jgi:hypothetical protein
MAAICGFLGKIREFLMESLQNPRKPHVTVVLRGRFKGFKIDRDYLLPLALELCDTHSTILFGVILRRVGFLPTYILTPSSLPLHKHSEASPEEHFACYTLSRFHGAALSCITQVSSK